MSECKTLRVQFLDGETIDYPLHAGRGNWHWSHDTVPKLVICPSGGMRQNDGVWQPRYELPAMNIRHVMIIRGHSED